MAFKAIFQMVIMLPAGRVVVAASVGHEVSSQLWSQPRILVGRG